MFRNESIAKFIFFIGGVDACKGDSGSAIQAEGTVDGKSKIVQYGIVSYGAKSCGADKGIPGVYTTVSKYLDWILDNLK